MPTIPSEYASFLVRLWREGNAEAYEATSGWHGEIEHIQSGQHLIFGTVEELLNHLRQQTNDLERNGYDQPKTTAKKVPR